MSYVRFANCTFNTGTATACYEYAGAGWDAYELERDECCDFSGSTITGFIGRYGPGIRPTAKNCWIGTENISDTNMLAHGHPLSPSATRAR